MSARAGDDQASSRRLRIEILDSAGADKGRVVLVAGPEATVGTAASCDVIVSDPTVSRLHVRLRAEEAGIRVLDAGSRNGTLVAGVLVLDGWADEGATITLGRTTLAVTTTDDVAALPLSSRSSFGPLLGRSIAMRRLFSLLERVAPTDHTLLIEGETGTGKELVAEAVHEASARSGGPLVVFDCSAVAPSLVESELFGHVQGAFTGAVGDRAGVFERAHGGTLFLDEIGELPLDLQPKLLRALERREVRRVGSQAVKKCDVRILAATHRSLLAEVERGRFREDLYYRLGVVTVLLPPLRERLEDVPTLVAHFSEQLLRRGRAHAPLREATIRAMTQQSWPGNVRELRNAVVRALTLGDAEPAAKPAAPEVLGGEVDLTLGLVEAREAFERAYVTRALERSGGNVTKAAALAGTNRRFLQRAMKHHGLRGDDGGE